MEDILAAAHQYIHENPKFVLAYNEFIVHRKLSHHRLALGIINYVCMSDWLPSWQLKNADRNFIIEQVKMMINDELLEMQDEDYEEETDDDDDDDEGGEACVV